MTEMSVTSSYLERLAATAEHLGVSYRDASDDRALSFASLYNDPSQEYPEITGPAHESEEEQESKEESTGTGKYTVDTSDMVISNNQVSEPSSPPVQGNGDRYVNSFNPGIKGFGTAHTAYGLRDILSICCLIMVGVSVVAAVVIDAIRKRNDPMRKYKRW